MDRRGRQRYRCRTCGKTFLERRIKPIGDMRISLDRAEFVLRLLLEGSSINSTVRLSGVSKPTILDLLVLVGERAEQFMRREFVDRTIQDAQIDETWGFTKMKERTRERTGASEEFGDTWTFTAVARESRLLFCHHIGKRTAEDTQAFCDKLARATCGRFQLHSDGYKPYCTAVPESFRDRAIDYVMLIKVYDSPPKNEQRRYSPAKFVSTYTRKQLGNPDMTNVCTSHVERHNLSIRTSVKRMARLTLSYSKKLRNHKAALALFFLFYNYGRVHGTLKTTPAIKHGLTDHVWSVREMLERIAD